MQFSLPPRPVVYHLVAPVVGHFLPSPDFVESTDVTNAYFGLPSNAHTSMQGDLTVMGVQAAARGGCTSTVTCDSPLKRSRIA